MDSLMNSLSKVEKEMNGGLFPTILSIFNKFKIEVEGNMDFFPFSEAHNFIGYDTMTCVGLVATKGSSLIEVVYMNDKRKIIGIPINRVSKEELSTIYEVTKKIGDILEEGEEI